MFLFYKWGVQKVVYYLHRFWVELRTAQLLPSLYLTANAARVALAWEPFDSCLDLNEYFKDVVLFWHTRQQNRPRSRKTETYDNAIVLLQRLTYKATGCNLIFCHFALNKLWESVVFSDNWKILLVRFSIKYCKTNEVEPTCTSICISFKAKNITLLIH